MRTRPRRQPRRLHVFNHLQAQRRHRGLPWFEQASVIARASRRISSTQTPCGERRPYGEAVQSNVLYVTQIPQKCSPNEPDGRHSRRSTVMEPNIFVRANGETLI